MASDNIVRQSFLVRLRPEMWFYVALVVQSGILTSLVGLMLARQAAPNAQADWGWRASAIAIDSIDSEQLRVGRQIAISDYEFYWGGNGVPDGDRSVLIATSPPPEHSQEWGPATLLVRAPAARGFQFLTEIDSYRLAVQRENKFYGVLVGPAKSVLAPAVIQQLAQRGVGDPNVYVLDVRNPPALWFWGGVLAIAGVLILCGAYSLVKTMSDVIAVVSGKQATWRLRERPVAFHGGVFLVALLRYADFDQQATMEYMAIGLFIYIIGQMFLSLVVWISWRVRRPFRLSLRGVMLLIAIISVPLAGVSWYLRATAPQRQMRREMDQIRRMKGLPCNAEDATFFAMFGLPNSPASADLADSDLAGIQGCTQIWGLGVAGTNVTDEGMLLVRELTSLTSLDLSRTRVGSEGVRNLRGLHTLVNIRLNDTKIDGDALTVLSEFPNLRTIDLRETRITDEDLANLYTLPELIRIDLSGTRVTEAGVRALQDHFPDATIVFSPDSRY